MKPQADEQERGVVLVLTSIALVSLMLITAIAIDVGYWYVHKNHLRQVAEAASLAGAAYMPDTTLAYPAAKAVMKQNGIEYWDGACDSTHQFITKFTPTAEGYGLDVDITDCKTTAFFSSIALGNKVSTTGAAGATIGVPIPLGSPSNHIGTMGMFSGSEQDNFWLAIDGYCVPKENGDRFSTGYDFNQTHTGIASWPVVPYVSGGSIFSSCGPNVNNGHGQNPSASWVGANHDFDLDSATGLPRAHGDSFYKYLVTVPKQGLSTSYDLLAYDPAAGGCDENVARFTPYSYYTDSTGFVTTNARLTCVKPTHPICYGKYRLPANNYLEANGSTCNVPALSTQCRGTGSTGGFCYDPLFFDTVLGCINRSHINNGYPAAPSGSNIRGCSYTGDTGSANNALQPDADTTNWSNLGNTPYAPVTTTYRLHSVGVSSLSPIGSTVICDSSYKTGFKPHTTAHPVTPEPSTYVAGSNTTGLDLIAPGLLTPSPAVPNWNNNTKWTKLCNSTPFTPSTAPGTYVLEVNTKFREQNSFSSNAFGLTLQPLGQTTLSACNADTALPANPCPTITAMDNLPAFYKLPNSTTPASFHLARLDKSSRGRLMIVSVWDPGEGMNSLEIGTPNAGGTAFGTKLDATAWQLKWRVGDNGCKTGNPGNWETPAAWATTIFPITVSGSKANTTQCDNNPALASNIPALPGYVAPNGKYNRNLVEFQVRVPSNYDPTNYNGDAEVGGWLWVRYNPVVNGATTDRTTWSLKVLGTPIRLIS